MLTVRSAALADVRDISSLWLEMSQFHADLHPLFQVNADAQAAFANHATEALGDPLNHWIVAELDERIVGFLAITETLLPPVYPERRIAFIQDACVTMNHRRQGIGEALYHRAVEWAIARGLTRIQLSAAVCNPVSMSFWSKVGFHPHMVTMVQTLPSTGKKI